MHADSWLLSHAVNTALNTIGWRMIRRGTQHSLQCARIHRLCSSLPHLFHAWRQWLPASNGEVCTQLISSRCHTVLNQCDQFLVRW
jgi:hypothetical protein